MQRLSVAFVTQRRFVADAAHELRTPATALRLQLQLLERADNAPTREAAMAELKTGINRAQHLIEQLLLLSRVEPDAPMQVREAVDLGDLVRQVVGVLSVTAEHKRIDLGAALPDKSDDLSPGSLVVDGNRHQLTVLLNNLVGNALRYTPAGGVVDVKVSRDDGLLTLRVVDNGPGVEPDERERVFDRFYRGRNLRNGEAPQGDEDTGSGLGLAIVKAIADQHGAVVSLYEAPSGQGLEVRVVFSAVG
jgi:signal transduction histidine kinase